MRRREFMAGLGIAAVLPAVLRAQQASLHPSRRALRHTEGYAMDATTELTRLSGLQQLLSL